MKSVTGQHLRHRFVWAILPALLLLGAAVAPAGARGVGAARAALPPRAPAAAQQDKITAARDRAVAWLHTQQNPDGGFGVRQPDGSYQSSAAATADVVYVLALSGENPAGPAWTVSGHSALDALGTLAPSYASSDAGQAGVVARAVAAAGGNPRAFAGLDLLSVIQAAYNPATGRYHPELLYRHTVAMEGVYRSGQAVPPEASQALLAAELPQGGWFWAFSGNQPDIDTTGRVLEVLSNSADLRCAPALVGAALYLAGQQQPNDGWRASMPTGATPDPPNSDSTALAVAGLSAAGYDVTQSLPPASKAGISPLDALLAYQEPGGAFVYMRQQGREESRLIATVDALAALAQVSGSHPAPCGRSYLPLRWPDRLSSGDR